MTPWDNPVPLQRIWCLYELVCAMRSEETELRIVLSEDQRQSLRAGLIADHIVVTQMLVQIRVENAKAMVPEDHEQLSVRTLHAYAAGPG